MRLVVDAGTTKTASAVISRDGAGEIIQRTTLGINPVTDITHDLKLHELLNPLKDQPIEEVFFYGSGCINTDVNDRLKSKIQVYLPNSTISVNDDLLGACIATCGTAPGITVILGTGSNIGYYDGSMVTDGIKSCGYLLGDEGSGYKIGQEIYKRFARGLLSSELSRTLESTFDVSQPDAISHLYQQSNPRQLIASCARFIHQVSDYDKLVILDKVFGLMIENMIKPIQQKYLCEVHFVGSIAFHFQQELKSIFKKNDIIAGSFVKTPLEGLIKHHT